MIVQGTSSLSIQLLGPDVAWLSNATIDTNRDKRQLKGSSKCKHKALVPIQALSCYAELNLT